MDVLARADLPFPQSLPEFQRVFPDDTACAAYLEKARWAGGFTCPWCGVIGDGLIIKVSAGSDRLLFRAMAEVSKAA